MERVDTIRYLGVILDERLTFAQHIFALSKRLRKLIHIMKQLRQGVDIKTLILVYKALCQSLLIYCISAWGSASKTVIISLERAQRSVLKVMLRKPFRYPTRELHCETKILTVRQLYILRVSLFQHRILMNSAAPVQHTLGRRMVIPTTRVKTSFARRFKSFSFPFIYKVAQKHCDVRNDTVIEARTKIVKWLSSLDYNSTESLLEIIK